MKDNTQQLIILAIMLILIVMMLTCIERHYKRTQGQYYYIPSRC